MRPEFVTNTATCKRCGSTDVTWQHSPRGKWYLTEVFTNERNELVTDYRDFHSNYCGKPHLHAGEQVKRDAEWKDEQRVRTLRAQRAEQAAKVDREQYFLKLVDMTPVERGKRIAEIEILNKKYRDHPPTMDNMSDFIREGQEAEARKTELEFLKALPYQEPLPTAKGKKK